MPDLSSYASPQVLEFYKLLPFNYRQCVSDQVKSIKSADFVSQYPFLPPLCSTARCVVEMGCGSGWLSNSIAYRYGCEVVGVDFNPVALLRARDVRRAMNLTTTFVEADLFLFDPGERAVDCAISLGVLHHTNDCARAMRRMCRLVRPGGHIVVGLYHKYGRKPFREYFERLTNSGADREALFARYRVLHSTIKDETLLRSWFRDQVLHPHETHHTQREMAELLAEEGMVLVSTSINRFAPIHSLEELFNSEGEYEDLGRLRLSQGRYFPGFFVFLARKSR